MVEELGIIERVFFGREDHGILTFMLFFDFGGSAQGFGGYALDSFDKAKDRRVGTAAGTDLILRLLDTFNVDSLNSIKGRYAYAIRKSEGFNAQIVGLRTPKPDGDKTLMIADWQAEWFPEALTV